MTVPRGTFGSSDVTKRENAALREFERQGIIQRVGLGPTIETPLDYRPNPDAAFLGSDLDEASLAKTDIATSASYAVAQLSVPVTWSKGDDAKNPTDNQKFALVKSLLENGIQTHDDLIEQAIFTTTTSGGDEFNGLDTLVPTSGTGTPGGIDASVETWWKNYSDLYYDATDVEAAFTAAWNAAAKGSGSTLAPKLIVSGATPHALFESTQQGLQRYIDKDEANAGFKVLAFKSSRYIFSQYGGSKVYFLNPKSYQIVFSRQYFRDKGNTIEIPSKNGFVFKIYSAGQALTNNKSRLAVLNQG